MNNSKTDCTQQTRQQIFDQYIRGRLPGERIPTEKQLSKEYQVSVTTVRRAVSLLEDSGFLKRRHGSGTFIGEALRIR